MSSQAHRLISGKIEARIISTMRLVLAISALLISAVAAGVQDHPYFYCHIFCKTLTAKGFILSGMGHH